LPSGPADPLALALERHFGWSDFRPGQRPVVEAVPEAPDYRAAGSWAALPGRADAADFVPRRAPAEVLGPADSLGVDVFFVHPTIYERGRTWNAAVDDRRMNRQVDKLPIRLQASAFGAGTRLYAPRYRQAHLGVFTWKDAESDRALDTAYADVRAAFEIYLREWNGGRAFVLAGHSQGSTHCGLLLQEFFDGKALQSQLVAAYLPGIGIATSELKQIPLLTTPSATGGYVTWNTFKKRIEQSSYEKWYKGKAVVNPVSWTLESTAQKTAHKGFLYFDNQIYPQLFDTHLIDGAIWIDRPKGKFFFLSLTMRNYHIGDINLFWQDIHDNAILRAASFDEK